MVWAAMGIHPNIRHDRAALDPSRAEKAGHPLGFRAVLVQIRADWPFLKALFSFPSWSSASICWMCQANKQDLDYKDVSSTAAWRTTRYAPHEFFACQRAAGIPISPIFGCPGADLGVVKLDWLHIVDLGVGQDILGNLFAAAVQSLPGSNLEERRLALWHKIKAYYKEQKPACQLTELTFEMFKRPGKSPKLKVKGGETRALYPFGLQLAWELKDTDMYWATVYQLMFQLMTMVQCLEQHPFIAAKLGAAARKFALLYTALEKAALDQDSTMWKVKPKLHLLLELAEYAAPNWGNPRFYWTYRDESWAGVWAKAGKRRGGANTMAAVAERLLQRFRALQSLSDPWLVFFGLQFVLLIDCFKAASEPSGGLLGALQYTTNPAQVAPGCKQLLLLKGQQHRAMSRP